MLELKSMIILLSILYGTLEGSSRTTSGAEGGVGLRLEIRAVSIWSDEYQNSKLQGTDCRVDVSREEGERVGRQAEGIRWTSSKPTTLFYFSELKCSLLYTLPKTCAVDATCGSETQYYLENMLQKVLDVYLVKKKIRKHF